MRRCLWFFSRIFIAKGRTRVLTQIEPGERQRRRRRNVVLRTVFSIKVWEKRNPTVKLKKFPSWAAVERFERVCPRSRRVALQCENDWDELVERLPRFVRHGEHFTVSPASGDGGVSGDRQISKRDFDAVERRLDCRVIAQCVVENVSARGDHRESFARHLRNALRRHKRVHIFVSRSVTDHDGEFWNLDFCGGATPDGSENVVFRRIFSRPDDEKVLQLANRVARCRAGFVARNDFSVFYDDAEALEWTHDGTFWTDWNERRRLGGRRRTGSFRRDGSHTEFLCECGTVLGQVESASKRREPDEFAQKVDVIVVDEGKIIAETALVVQSRRRAAARSEI